VTETEVKEALRKFIFDVFYLADPEQVTDDTMLIREGIVDSTGILDIILFIESDFAITVTDVETTPENFDTINRIAAYVERKRNATAVES
jgi:acyl carrier protein